MEDGAELSQNSGGVLRFRRQSFQTIDKPLMIYFFAEFYNGNACDNSRNQSELAKDTSTAHVSVQCDCGRKVSFNLSISSKQSSRSNSVKTKPKQAVAVEEEEDRASETSSAVFVEPFGDDFGHHIVRPANILSFCGLFVGNIKTDCNRKLMQKIFTRYGNVVRMYISPSKDARTYAFVDCE